MRFPLVALVLLGLGGMLVAGGQKRPARASGGGPKAVAPAKATAKSLVKASGRSAAPQPAPARIREWIKQHGAELRARADLDHDGHVDAQEQAKAREALRHRLGAHGAGPGEERSQADQAARAPVKKSPDHLIPITPHEIYETRGAAPKGGGAQRAAPGRGHAAPARHGGKHRSSQRGHGR